MGDDDHEIVLRIESAGEPLVGWVSGGTRPPVHFIGWLELASELTTRLDSIAAAAPDAITRLRNR